MRRSNGLLARSFLALVVPLVLASSCADQAEGERCDPRNNDSDCESGLICVRLSTLDETEKDANVGLCCPPNASQASDVCSGAGYNPPPPPPDAGTSDATPDAAGD